MKYLFTSESVTKGHPDKVCDQISDAILDACIAKDPFSRVAVETTVRTDHVSVMGELTTNAKVNYEKIIRDTIRAIGYTQSDIGFDADSVQIECHLHRQSEDIAMGVDNAYDNENTLGAGDQGMMFGYATEETESYLPLTLDLANKLALRLTEVREQNVLDYLRPDGKTQVTVEYEDGVAKRIDTVVVSTQHKDTVNLQQLRADILYTVIMPVLPKDMVDDKTRFLINPTGRFVVGGPAADTGLTGRKIIADTYGGAAPHGGGAFSGKDGTKVDRSGAYMARYIAKNIVANKLAKQCTVQLSYAIGVAQPVSVFVDTKGTGVTGDELLCNWVKETFDCTPQAMIRLCGLRQPIFHKTSAYGHYGKEELPWERVDASLRKRFAEYCKKHNF